jgi:hypothetical protein
VSSAGVEGNDESYTPSISADGRYVAFHSDASNLVSGDTNNYEDVFVHDRQTGETTRVSVDSTGVQGNYGGEYPSISADGRYVVFRSYATNLVPGDTNGRCDIFDHDRQTGQTTRVSVDSAGVQGNYGSYYSSISADGRYVAFISDASNLVPGDTNDWSDVFVHDRQTGETTRVSVSSAGVEGNYDCYSPSISADGRFVAFITSASNLVPGDTSGSQDVFVHHYGEGPDLTPDPFTFTDQTGVALSVEVISNSITVSGIDVPVSISIAGGEYSINGGGFTVSPGTVGNSDTVRAKIISSDAYGTTVDAIVTIGGATDTFSVTTIHDTTPVDGVCGSSNGGTFPSVPTTNLCSEGTPSAVAGIGPWTWTCQGLNGGTDASCSANLAGTTCDYTVSTPKPAKYKGGTVSLKVTGSDKSCPAPDVVNTSDWIVSLPMAWSNGKGTLKLTAEANDVASERSAEITVGDTPVTITQQGAPCKISAFIPKKGIIGASGGTGSFSFTFPQGCGWTTALDEKGAPWLTLDTASGDGSGEIGYSAAANTSGKALSGKIIVTVTPTGKAKKYSVKQEK